MSSLMSVKEGDKPFVDMADVLVRISKKVSLPPLEKKFSKISVYTSKEGDGNDLEGLILTESNKNEHQDKIKDKSELNFSGSIKVWNVAKLQQKHVDAMVGYGTTLVVTSSKVDEIRKNESNLDFKNLIVFLSLSDGNITDEHQSFAKMPNRGIFIDTDKKGKLLFALSRLLKNPETLQFSTQIPGMEFKGVLDLSMSQQLDAMGLSYFFKANDFCWPRGFWIGGQQARSIYADRSVLHDTREAISRMIQKGIDLTEESLSILETLLLQALQSNPFVTHIYSIHIPFQRAANKVLGEVSGVSIRYETAKEVRTVSIELDSSGDF